MGGESKLTIEVTQGVARGSRRSNREFREPVLSERSILRYPLCGISIAIFSLSEVIIYSEREVNTSPEEVDSDERLGFIGLLIDLQMRGMNNKKMVSDCGERGRERPNGISGSGRQIRGDIQASK